MFSRRDFLQVAAATAALLPGGWTRAFAQQRLTQDELLRFDAARQRHAGARRRHSRPARARAVPRAVGQSRHRRGEGTRAACHRPGASRPLQDRARLGGGLRPHLGGFRGARQELRPARRARPHRHHPQGDPRRARRSRGFPRRRRHLAEQLHLADQQGPGHGRLHGAAEAGRHDRALGVHPRRRARQGDRRRARFSLPCAEHARYRMERAGVRADDHARARRRPDRRDRAGLSLYADRQSALDDAELVVRHSRRRRAGQCGQGAPRRRRAGRAAVAQRLRRRPQARRARQRHRRDPDGAHPRRAARRGEGRQDPAGRVRQPRQVRVAARSRCPRRRGEGLSLQADPGVLRCDRARCRDGGEDPRRARAARGDAGRGGRPDRDAALPPRQFQRHARRPDLRRAARRARRRDRIVAGLPLGQPRCCPARTSRARTSTTPPPSPIRPPIG